MQSVCILSTSTFVLGVTINVSCARSDYASSSSCHVWYCPRAHSRTITISLIRLCVYISHSDKSSLLKGQYRHDEQDMESECLF